MNGDPFIELRDKVKGKMEVAKFFAGFISVVFGFLFRTWLGQGWSSGEAAEETQKQKLDSFRQSFASKLAITDCSASTYQGSSRGIRPVAYFRPARAAGSFPPLLLL